MHKAVRKTVSAHLLLIRQAGIPAKTGTNLWMLTSMTKLSKFAAVIFVLSHAGSAGAQEAHYSMSAAWPASIGSGFETMEFGDACRAILVGINKAASTVSPEHWFNRKWQKPLRSIDWSILPAKEGIGYARMFSNPASLPSAFHLAIKQGSDINSYSIGTSNVDLYGTEGRFPIYAVFDKSGHAVSAFVYKGGAKSLLTSFRSIGGFLGQYNGQLLVNGRYFQWSADFSSWEQAGPSARTKRWQVAVYMAFPPDPELDTPDNRDVPMPKICNFPYHPK